MSRLTKPTWSRTHEQGGARHRRQSRHRSRVRHGVRNEWPSGRHHLPGRQRPSPCGRRARREMRCHRQQVDAAFAQIEQQLGPVEILVSNAGITRDMLVLRMSEDDFTSVIDANLTGGFRVAKRAVKHDEGPLRSHHLHLVDRRPSVKQARPTTRRRRPGSPGSPARWPRSSPPGASPSTSWRPAPSPPTCSTPSPTTTAPPSHRRPRGPPRHLRRRRRGHLVPHVRCGRLRHRCPAAGRRRYGDGNVTHTTASVPPKRHRAPRLGRRPIRGHRRVLSNNRSPLAADRMNWSTRERRDLRPVPATVPSRSSRSPPRRSPWRRSFADDLDADSLDLVEFVMALEEEFDVNVEEEELQGIDTVGAAFDLINRSSDRLDARVAVAGIGAVPPCGIGVDAFWQGLRGQPPTSQRRIEDFDPEPYFDNPKEARRSDRFTQFALRRPPKRWPRPVRPADPHPHRRLGRHRCRRHRHARGADHHLPREGAPAGVTVPRPHDDGQRRGRRISMR